MLKLDVWFDVDSLMLKFDVLTLMLKFGVKFVTTELTVKLKVNFDAQVSRSLFFHFFVSAVQKKKVRFQPKQVHLWVSLLSKIRPGHPWERDAYPGELLILMVTLYQHSLITADRRDYRHTVHIFQEHFTLYSFLTFWSTYWTPTKMLHLQGEGSVKVLRYGRRGQEGQVGLITTTGSYPRYNHDARGTPPLLLVLA